MDILATINGFVNPAAVLIAVFLTQAVKYFLPSPSVIKTTEVIPGHLATRILPFVPVVIAIAFCFAIENDGKFTMNDAIRGFMSGIMASYLYRTTKVTIFGE
jgi:hypothetical protein